MKKYNKSEIMKNAWSLYRNSVIKVNGKVLREISFSQALKDAWAKAKANLANQKKLGWVFPTVLNVGDTLQVVNRLSYVKYEKEIASIEKAGLSFDGTVVTFADGELRCFPNHLPVQRLAVTAA